MPVWKAEPVLPSHRVLSVLAASVLGLMLTACSGSESDGGPHADPDGVLAEAKQALDETSGVHLTLTTDDLPGDVTGIKSADGTATHAPAFDGKLTVVLSGQAFEVPVIAVDGKVYAQLPLSTGWQDVDPGDYGAPDPAQLMKPDEGFSALLAHTDDVAEGDSVRGGADNKEVLTEFTGTVDADVVQGIIPTATGDFDVVYAISDSGELRSAALTGVFYTDSDSMTYTVTFDDYGTEKDITAP